jgi:putative transposase
VSTFCAEHQTSRKTFYAIRARTRTDGAAAALEPRSRRPKNSPTQIADEVKRQALGVRASLESSGLDHGPISVHDKMHAMGLDPVPSVASLARIFRRAGVARFEPKKKPRSAWRRFVLAAPTACWQLDATEYVLSGGRKCVIFQLIDDHSRFAVASHMAQAGTVSAAIVVFDKVVADHGVPQRFAVRQPGRAQPVPTRVPGRTRGRRPAPGRGSDHRPAGSPGMRRGWWLPRRPRLLVPSRAALLRQAAARRFRPAPVPTDLPSGIRVKKLTTAGTFILDSVHDKVDGQRGLREALVITHGDKITVADLEGEVLIEHTRPAPGATFVGNGRSRGPRPRAHGSSPKF